MNDKPFGIDPDPMSPGEWVIVIALALGFCGLAFIGGLVLFNVLTA